MRNVRSSSDGFTLVEILVYLALFAIISLVVLNSLGATGRVLSSLRSTRGTTDATLLAFDRMTRSIQAATSITVGSSTLGTSPGRLVLDTGTQIFLSGTTLMIQESTGAAAPLAPPSVSFSSLIFRKIQTAGSQGVKIEATVGGKNMYSTAVLRGSY